MIYCLICGSNPIENKDTGECASCGAARRKAQRAMFKEEQIAEAKKSYKLPKVSEKRKKENSIYEPKRKAFLENKMCAVFPTLQAQDVHHMKGRNGYADQWAKDNDIPLLIDERFWLPVSRKGHVMIELKPAWSIEKGYSLSRNEIMK